MRTIRTPVGFPFKDGAMRKKPKRKRKPEFEVGEDGNRFAVRPITLARARELAQRSMDEGKTWGCVNDEDGQALGIRILHKPSTVEEQLSGKASGTADFYRLIEPVEPEAFDFTTGYVREWTD